MNPENETAPESGDAPETARAGRPRAPHYDLDRPLDLPAGYAVLQPPPKLWISIDPAIVYPALLAEFEAKCGFDGEIDQYWLECCYQCAKLDAQRAFIFAGGRYGTDPFESKILGRPEFALRNHPEGRGAWAATQGHEARGHYKTLRGFIPGA